MIFVREAKWRIASVIFCVGLTPLAVIKKLANSTSFSAKWNLSGLKTIPFFPHWVIYSIMCQNEDSQRRLSSMQRVFQVLSVIISSNRQVYPFPNVWNPWGAWRCLWPHSVMNVLVTCGTHSMHLQLFSWSKPVWWKLD